MVLALTELLPALIFGIYFVGGGNANYCVLLQSSCRMKVDKANFTVFNQLMAFFRQGRQLMEESEEEVETRLCGRESGRRVGVGGEGGGESKFVSLLAAVSCHVRFVLLSIAGCYRLL